MRKFLVVANQTLGGTELKAEIERRIADGDCEFHVVVPVTRLEDYHGSTGGSADLYGQEDQARKQAHRRMMALVGEIRDAGAKADGELGDANPLVAIQKAISTRHYDEIVLSTFPQGVSKWLKMDLPSRVERAFDGPVKSIISAA